MVIGSDKLKNKAPKIKKNKRADYRKNGFGLLGVIIIIIITAIVSSIATGVIVINNNNVLISDYDLENDKYLNEFIDVYHTILDKYYDELDKKGMIEAAEKGMLNFLGDKYTTFLSDSEYNNLLDGLKDSYEGIGITIQGNLIKDVSEGSPAEKAGLKKNDIIISINNKNVENVPGEEITSLIKDDSSKTVSLVIKRDGVLTNYTVTKSDLEYPYVSSKLVDNTTIGYLSITAFSNKLAGQVEKNLKDLENKGMTSLIIDLRNNGGGYLNAATDTASLFLTKGLTIFSLSSTAGKTVVKDETDEHRSYPIVVLMNKQTASAAEILAAALKQSYNATLVGTQSYGKGKVQQISTLSNGDSMKYTTAEWLTPNGLCIDGVGLQADVNIDITYNYDESGKVVGYTDSQIEKAIEILK